LTIVRKTRHKTSGLFTGETMPAKKSTKKSTLRLPQLVESKLNPAQRALLNSMRSGPRGKSVSLGGPFGCYMHAPEIGEAIQQLSAFCRFKTRLPKRLSEFAILTVGRLWKSQYEFHVHSGDGERAGLKPRTIRALKVGRKPTKAPRDEQALYDFIIELHKKQRVSNRNYTRVQKLVGNAGLVELLAIMGAYTLTCMVLNTFRVPLPEGATPPYAEPKV
jgi:4-carboxymuconolactone decarboxylase